MIQLLKKLSQKIKEQRGYSLVELSVSTSILALLAVGGLAVMQKKTNADRIKETISKMERIETALTSFTKVNGRLPCPALPSLMEGDANFGKSEGMTIGTPVTVTAATMYNDSNDANQSGTDSCTNNGMDALNKTGMVPVRTLNLTSDYAYDGWGRKFTYSIADGAGGTEDFEDINFRGDIRIVDLAGTNKTNIDNPPPQNDGAIYVIISHGENGKNVAWRKNFDYANNPGQEPVSATGIERQNTVHKRKSYIQDNSTDKFDDIVVFGSKNSVIPPRIIEAPVMVDEETCTSALALASNSSILDTYAGTGTNERALATTIGNVARNIALFCNNAPTSTQNYRQPLEVTGMMLWLDATDPNGDSSLPSDGSDVDTWVDKSGNRNHANASSTEPTFELTGINNRPSIIFNGSSNYFDIDDFDSHHENNVTIMAVVRPDSLGGDDHRAIFSTGATNGWQLELINVTSASMLNRIGVLNYHSSGNNWSAITDDNALPSTLPETFLVEYTRQDATQAVYYNGIAVNTTLVGTDFYTNSGNKHIGKGYSSGGSVYFDGLMGEVLIFNRKLPDRDRTGIEIYLNSKWGISGGAATTHNCPYEGQTFRTTTTDPVGGCHCQDGYQIILNLETLNACSTNINTFGSCVQVRSRPNYGTYSPSLSDMALWLDANDCTTLTLTSDSAASSATRYVTQWRDKGPRNKHFVNNSTTLAEHPLYVSTEGSSVFTGKPFIRFSSTNATYLEEENSANAVNLLNRTGATIFAVIRPQALGSSDKVIIGRKSTSVTGWLLSIDNSNSAGKFRVGANGTLGGYGYSYGATSLAASSEYILSATYKGGSVPGVDGEIKIYLNGLEDTTGSSLVTPPNYRIDNAGPVARIGSDSSSVPTGFYDGEIAELIVYESFKTPTQRRLVENYYLGPKWGITMGSLTPAPGGIENGLQLWLDASSGSTLFDSDTCGTTTSIGSGVGCWKSKRNNLYAKQLTAANRPILTTSTINGTSRPTVAFDGSNDILQITSGVSAANAQFSFAGNATFITVVESDNVDFSGFNRGLLSKTLSSTNGTSSGGFVFGHRSNPGYPMFATYPASSSPQLMELRGTTGENVLNNNEFVIYSFVKDGSSPSFYKNGTQYILNSSNGDLVETDTAFANSHPLNIGAKYPDNDYWDGNIGEILAYNQALTTAQISSVHSALSSKWYIPLSTGNCADDTSLIVTAGLQLWLDANDPTCDGSTQWTNLTHVGGSGNIWKDKSGNSTNASNTTTTTQPKYYLSVMASKPAIRFDGTDDFLSIPNISNLSGTAFTAVTVVEPGVASNSGPFLGNNSNGSAEFAFVTPGIRIRPFINNSATLDYTTYSTIPQIITVMNDMTSIKLYLNGSQLDSEASPVGGTFHMNQIGRAGGGGSQFNGDVGEILIFNRFLNSTELNSVICNYLQLKWGTPTCNIGGGASLDSSSPTHNATAVNVTDVITLNFSAAVTAGSGYININNTGNSSDNRQIDVNDSQVTFTGSTVTINPANDFQSGATYDVVIPAGVIVPFPGITVGNLRFSTN